MSTFRRSTSLVVERRVVPTEEYSPIAREASFEYGEA
jgi:hypothetical protein